MVKMMKETHSLFQEKKILIGVFVFCLMTSISSAQWMTNTKKYVTDSKTDLLDAKPDLKSMLQTPSTIAPALEGPVDPDKYFVGPSDVFSVNIWLSLPINFSVTVTPEGTLIVPTVGEIRVADCTLREAKKRVIEEIKKKYQTGVASVTLISPRQIIVTVTGMVRNPGKYVVYATDRVDKAIAMADRVQKDQIVENTEEWWQKILHEGQQSKRNIHLTRRTGENLRVDILRYYATQYDQLNPLLREGDEIFVPRVDMKKSVFGVYGGVNVQGSFELVDGDSLLDAIKLAYGFTVRAQMDSIGLYRYNGQTNDQIFTNYDFNQVKHGSRNNIKLIPGDRIVVKEHVDMREDYKVYIEGEVKFPGFYPIAKDSTKLSVTLKMAGGFTEYASLPSAQVYRGTISWQELEIERLLSLRGNISQEDSAYYLLETELRTKRQVVNVDFKKLFVNNDPSEDIYMKNGDVVSIPSILRTIYIFGQVVNPGNVPFISGMDYQYYIQKCGGFTENARTSDVMIIKRATRQWLSPKETKVEEGDYVWVPKEPQRTFAYWMNIFNQTAAVVTAAVSIALLAVQLNK